VTVKERKPKKPSQKSSHRLGKDQFRYEAAADVYVCPNGENLTPRSPYTDRIGVLYVRCERSACPAKKRGAARLIGMATRPPENAMRSDC